MIVIDVRSPEEYKSERAENSINIPLQEIKNRLSDIKYFSQPIILCCASGNRSGKATALLKNEGIDCTNGGTWVNIQ